MRKRRGSLAFEFALYEVKDTTSTTTGAQVGFRVADLDAAHERATAAGAVVLAPALIAWGWPSRTEQELQRRHEGEIAA